MDKKTKKIIIIVSSVLGTIVLALVALLIYINSTKSAELENIKEQNALNEERLALEKEYTALETEYQEYESQQKYLNNDSLINKYAEAKDKVQKLLVELQQEKKSNKINRNRIDALTREIGTLRGLLKHYVAQIDSLSKENKGLREENSEVKRENQSLSNRVNEVARKNEVLSERMTLAEKLNITGLSVSPVKNNGKTAKKVKDIKQFVISFQIAANPSTPAGQKSIYVRITTPEGEVLTGGGQFSFEGSSLNSSARKVVEYDGQETPVTMYWNVNHFLSAGTYGIEVFCDNYRIGKRSFSLDK